MPNPLEQYDIKHPLDVNIAKMFCSYCILYYTILHRTEYNIVYNILGAFEKLDVSGY